MYLFHDRGWTLSVTKVKLSDEIHYPDISFECFDSNIEMDLNQFIIQACPVAHKRFLWLDAAYLPCSLQIITNEYTSVSRLLFFRRKQSDISGLC